MVHCDSLPFSTFDCVRIHLLDDSDWPFEQKLLQKMDFGNLNFQRKIHSSCMKSVQGACRFPGKVDADSCNYRFLNFWMSVSYFRDAWLRVLCLDSRSLV